MHHCTVQLFTNATRQHCIISLTPLSIVLNTPPTAQRTNAQHHSEHAIERLTNRNCSQTCPESINKYTGLFSITRPSTPEKQCVAAEGNSKPRSSRASVSGTHRRRANRFLIYTHVETNTSYCVRLPKHRCRAEIRWYGSDGLGITTIWNQVPRYPAKCEDMLLLEASA